VNMNNQCAICGHKNVPPVSAATNAAGGACPRCGTYYLVDAASGRLNLLIEKRLIDRSILSHRIRRRFEADGKPIFLTEANLDLYVGDMQRPTPEEQIDNFILWIGRTQKTPQDCAAARIERLAAIVGVAISDVNGEPGFAWLMQQIEPEKLVVNTTENSELRYRLTMAAWKRFKDLQKQSIASRTAFMAMKFNEPTLMTVLTECFKPATKRAGFTLRLMNEEQPAGLIDNQIRAAIRAARFLVADLTHDNNGAYFEAGFAEGLGLPVIYTCEASKFRDKKTHFDTNHMHTIPWELEHLEEAGVALTATIRATLPGESRLVD
jgi:hypothetical protein